MSRAAKDFLEKSELIAFGDTQPPSPGGGSAEDAHHLVTRIWSDAALLVFEFNRNFPEQSQSSNCHAMNLEIEPGIMKLSTRLRPQIGFDLRLELQNRLNPPQLIRTLRQMEPDGSTGLLILCDTFDFEISDGMLTITRPGGPEVPASKAARMMLEPLFNRIADAL